MIANPHGQHPPLRVGIISAAWGARAHLPAWRSLDGIEVTAICTSRPETAAKAAAEFAVEQAFHDFRALAEDPDIDIIDVCTPSSYHAPLSIAALGAGKHVICEKPLAPSPGDIRSMIEARDRSGKKLMPAHD